MRERAIDPHPLPDFAAAIDGVSALITPPELQSWADTYLSWHMKVVSWNRQVAESRGGVPCRAGRGALDSVRD